MNFKKWFYENTIFSEINRRIATQMGEIYNEPEKYAFKNIFKKAVPDDNEATRFVVPFINDEIGVSILNKINSADYDIDFIKKVIVKRDTRREIRIGKYILDKRSPFTEEEKKWWIRQGDAVEALKTIAEADQYAIVISRNPYDVVRMGDFEEIRNQSGGRSCHHPDGSHFDCAVEEANNSGGVAYVIRKDDLNKINLNDKEIFADEQRRIPGIKPISRLRLRKFVNSRNEDEELAIPEDRLYGKPIPGFAESLRKTMLAMQDDLIKSKDKNRPRLKDYVLVGGHYEDTSGSTLFNKFFGDALDRGEAQHRSSSRSRADIWDEECQETQAKADKMKHFGVYYDVDEAEGIAYVSYGGSIYFEFKKEIVNPQFMEKIEEEESRYLFERNYHKIIENAFEEKMRTGIVDTQVEFGVSDRNLEIRISFRDSTDQNNPDTFRSFVDDLIRDDGHYEEIRQAMMHALSQSKTRRGEMLLPVLKPAHYLPDEVTDEQLELEDQTKFKHFGFELEENQYDATATMKNMELIYRLDAAEYKKIDLFVKNNTNIFTNANQKVLENDDKLKTTKYKLETIMNRIEMRTPINKLDWQTKEKIIEEKISNFIKSSSVLLTTHNSSIFYVADKNAINQQVAEKLLEMYKRYENLESSQKYLFDEPQFKNKLLMTGYDSASPYETIRKMFTDDVKKNVSFFVYNRPEKTEINFKILIKFDSSSQEIAEQKMFHDFIEFLDNNYEKFVGIVQSIWYPILKNMIEPDFEKSMQILGNDIANYANLINQQKDKEAAEELEELFARIF